LKVYDPFKYHCSKDSSGKKIKKVFTFYIILHRNKIFPLMHIFLTNTSINSNILAVFSRVPVCQLTAANSSLGICSGLNSDFTCTPAGPAPGRIVNWSIYRTHLPGIYFTLK
jgi:hypothetical protein